MPRRQKCSACDERSLEKFAVFYWGWTFPTGDRTSYKQFFDFECSTPMLRRVVKAEQHPDNCLACGVPIAEDEAYAPVYGTMYLPGKERRDVELPYHPSCFEHEADLYKHGATALDERPRGGGGGPAAPTTNRWDSWDSMGITPA